MTFITEDVKVSTSLVLLSAAEEKAQDCCRDGTS